MRRSVLDPFYTALGALGALFILATLVVQVVGIAGRELGYSMAGLDAYAGYCLAAGSFLAMAYALRRQGVSDGMQPLRLTGVLRVQAHYYEEGNVQLNVENTKRLQVQFGSVFLPLSSLFINIITNNNIFVVLIFNHFRKCISSM